MTPADVTCIRSALVAHYSELAQRGEIPCAQVPILADIDVNQLKGMIDMDANKETMRTMLKRVDGYGMAIAALESAHDQMSQCEKMFRDDAEFMSALEEVRAVLRYNGRMS